MLKYITLSLIALAAPVNAGTVDDVRKIHNKVNLEIKYRSDYKESSPYYDSWELPTKYGDCEDIALLKKKRLLEIGFTDEDVRLIIVKTPSRDNSVNRNKNVLYLHVVVHIKSLSVILDIKPLKDHARKGPTKANVPVLTYDNWMQKNNALFYCDVNNEELGDKIKTKLRC